MRSDVHFILIGLSIVKRSCQNMKTCFTWILKHRLCFALGSIGLSLNNLDHAPQLYRRYIKRISFWYNTATMLLKSNNQPYIHVYLDFVYICVFVQQWQVWQILSTQSISGLKRGLGGLLRCICHRQVWSRDHDWKQKKYKCSLFKWWRSTLFWSLELLVFLAPLMPCRYNSSIELISFGPKMWLCLLSPLFVQKYLKLFLKGGF